MAESEGSVHPGNWLADAKEEFHKLPPWGKLAVGALAIGAVALGYYEYQKGKVATSPGGATLPASDPSTMGGSQSPFGMVPGANGSSIPLIPFGDTPIFDAQGNLIGWQQGGSNNTGGTGTGDRLPPQSNPPDKQPPPPASFLIPHLAMFRANADGTYSWRLPNTSNWQTINVPKGTRVFQGSQGRIWYQIPGQQQQILNPDTSGGNHNGPNMSSMMSNPLLFFQSEVPHVSTAGRG